jgi:hypothetical protein
VNGAPDITFTLNLAEDPDRTSAEDFADALTQALRFNDDGTFRAIDVADASTDPLLGGVAFEQIFAGDLFTFAAGTPLNVLMETTSFLQTTGLPDYGFSVSNVTPPADPAPTSPPLLLIDNLTSSAADWEALPASQGFTFAIAIGDGAPVDVVMPADYSRATRTV